MILFGSLLALTAITRLIELRVSSKHRRELLQNGAAAADERGFVGMALLHTGILSGALIEAVLFERSAPAWLSVPAALGVVAASALRLWAIRSLGRHWNVRVINSTSLGVIQSGPYRSIRHPNYVAVFSELALLPLVAGAWVTATLGTALHVWVLAKRIRHEESVLNQSAEYRRTMANKPRFLPRFQPWIRHGAPGEAASTRQT